MSETRYVSVRRRHRDNKYIFFERKGDKLVYRTLDGESGIASKSLFRTFSYGVEKFEAILALDVFAAHFKLPRQSVKFFSHLRQNNFVEIKG